MKKFTLLLIAVMSAFSLFATETPEGQVSYYLRSGSYKYVWKGSCTTKTQAATYVTVVRDGNDFYFQHLLREFSQDYLVKGTLGEDGRTITIASDIPFTERNFYNGNEEYTGKLYLAMFKKQTKTVIDEYSGEPEDSVYYTYDPETPITYILEGNTISLQNSKDGDEALGLVIKDVEGEYAYKNGTWYYDLEYETVLTLGEQPVSVPEGAEAKSYILKLHKYGWSDNDDVHFVKIYTLGNDVYFEDSNYLTESTYTIKGTREGNKVKFEANQIASIQWGQKWTFDGVKYQVAEANEYGYIDVSGEVVDPFYLTYDEATDTYSAVDGEAFCLTCDNGYSTSENVFCNMKIESFVDKLYTPAKPEEVNYYEDDKIINVMIPALSVDGEYMNPDNLYCCYYVNGNVYTFPASLYGLEEDMSEFKAYQDYGYYINSLGGESKSQWRYTEILDDNLTLDKIGVQYIYRFNGEERRSEIMEYIINPAAISATPADNAQQTDAARYDLHGRRVGKNHKGLTIIGHKTYLY